jgi:hypothetical protein
LAEGDISVSPVTDEDQWRLFGSARLPRNRKLGRDNGGIRMQPETQVAARDEIIAWAVVLEAENLAGVCTHLLACPVEYWRWADRRSAHS